VGRKTTTQSLYRDICGNSPHWLLIAVLGMPVLMQQF